MRLRSLIILFLATVLDSQAYAESILGKWLTIDDATKKPKSIVEIYRSGDEFRGKIVTLIDPPAPNPLCKKCSGDKKNKPIQGMDILWHMKESKPGRKWEDGTILDPQNGKTYDCMLIIKDDPKLLEIRGFIGISLVGRSQTWQRVH